MKSLLHWPRDSPTYFGRDFFGGRRVGAVGAGRKIGTLGKVGPYSGK